MARDEAVATINSVHRQLADTMRAVVRALNDDRISAFEGILLGNRGADLIMLVASLLVDLSKDQRLACLHAWEHGHWVVPEDAPPLPGGRGG
jgi:hypothetical protein